MDEMNRNNNEVINNTAAPDAQNTQGFANNDDPMQNTYYGYGPNTTANNVNMQGAQAPMVNEDPSRAKAKNSLIFGIIAAASAYVCGCFPISIIFGIIAIVWAVKAKKLSMNKKMPGMGVGGLICGIVGVILGAFMLFVISIIVLAIILDPTLAEEFYISYNF